VLQVQPASPTTSRPIALGIERIGFVSLRFTKTIGVILLVLTVAAFFGIERIKVDDSLSHLFRSETPEFKQFEEVSRRFPSNEYDVFVVVEGKTLLTRDALDKLRDFVTDVQLIEGVRGIISVFSARRPPVGNRIPAPLFPEPLPEGASFETLISEVKTNEIIRGKLLSEDGELTLAVLALDPAATASGKLDRVIAEIRKTADENLKDSGLTARLAGVPVMQLEIRHAVERDSLMYNAFGFVAGGLIAIVFFRRFSFMLIAAAPPLLAIVLALGTLGWLEFSLNMFLNVMTPLIMVISFSDSMQLTFHARDQLAKGKTKRAAFRDAIAVVGPACVLTHVTAGLSFVALQFSDSDLIRTFGQAGLISTIIALLGVLMLVPFLGMLLIRNETRVAEAVQAGDLPINSLRHFCSWIAAKMVRRPGLYSLIDLVIVIALGVAYLHLPPRYRLADQVPDRDQAVAASQRLDQKLAGASPIDIYVKFPQGQSLYSPQTLAVIAAVHDAVEKQAGVGNVWSLETLRRWLKEKAGKPDLETLKQYVDILPEHLTRRFLAKEGDAVIVTGRIPDIDASQLLPIVQDLDKAMKTIGAQHRGYEIAVTGLASIAARSSASMIGKLNQGLTAEIVLVAGFIGLAFGSVVVMLASVLPAVLPVFLAGVLLWITGQGLQFASVVALIVSFGLGLSATIHFLNRLRLESAATADPRLAVERATILMGPPLILTSVVLACGLVVTVFSDLPSLRLFGWLSAFAMLAALAADLLVLRPTIMWLWLTAAKLKARRA
jgi:uncharacterized protein